MIRTVPLNEIARVTMRVLLRHRETGQYYAGFNGWTGSSFVAHDFDTVDSATQLARMQKLAGMELVLHYDKPVCDLVLPLREEP